MSVPAFLRRIFGGLGGADRSVHELAVLCDALLGEKGEYASTAIARDALAKAREMHTVIAERLVAGRTVIHVLSQTQPGADFTSVEGGLEDVYFSTLAATRAAQAPAASRAA